MSPRKKEGHWRDGPVGKDTRCVSISIRIQIPGTHIQTMLDMTTHFITPVLGGGVGTQGLLGLAGCQPTKKGNKNKNK